MNEPFDFVREQERFLREKIGDVNYELLELMDPDETKRCPWCQGVMDMSMCDDGCAGICRECGSVKAWRRP